MSWRWMLCWWPLAAPPTLRCCFLGLLCNLESHTMAWGNQSNYKLTF